MKNLKLVLLWAFVICCIGTACVKRIKTTSFIVGPTLSASPGISVGGKLQWVTSNGPPFVVHFYSESPCVGGKNDIPGTKEAPAACTIKTDMDGLFKFAILPPGDSTLISKYPILYAQVDWCPKGKCAASAPPPPSPPYHPVKTTKIPNPPLVPIDCDESNKAYADPPTLQVYAGQEIAWQQVGPDATTKWQTTVPAPVCLEGTIFGTIVPGSPVICTVTSDAKAGETLYSLTYQDTSKTPTKTCTGTANLVINKP